MPVRAIATECVATGYGHNDRELCRVVIMDKKGCTLIDTLVKPEKEIVSYLTPLTGIKPGDLDNAEPWSVAREKIYSVLSPNTTLLGHTLNNSIKLLQLMPRVHFIRILDTSEFFCTWNKRSKRVEYFSLAHMANVLFGENMVGVHNPMEGCKACVQIYAKFKDYDEQEIRPVQRKLAKAPRTPSKVKSFGFSIDGVCLAGYSPQYCKCGQETLKARYYNKI